MPLGQERTPRVAGATGLGPWQSPKIQRFRVCHPTRVGALSRGARPRGKIAAYLVHISCLLSRVSSFQSPYARPGRTPSKELYWGAQLLATRCQSGTLCARPHALLKNVRRGKAVLGRGRAEPPTACLPSRPKSSIAVDAGCKYFQMSSNDCLDPIYLRRSSVCSATRTERKRAPLFLISQPPTLEKSSRENRTW